MAIILSKAKHYQRIAAMLRNKEDDMNIAYKPKDMAPAIDTFNDTTNPTSLITDLYRFAMGGSQHAEYNVICLRDADFNTSNVTRWDECFKDNTAYTDFPEFLDISGATSVTNMFSGCTKITTIGFLPECIKISGLDISASKLLTAASVESIIEGLDQSTTSSRTIKLNKYYETNKSTKTLVESLGFYDDVVAAGWTIQYV